MDMIMYNTFHPAHYSINDTSGFSIADKHTLILLLRLSATENPFELLL